MRLRVGARHNARQCEDECVPEKVRLTAVPDEGVAEALCGLLRSEGIECFYRDTDVSAAGIFGGTSFGGWREILVAEDDLERARALLPEQPP
jgi:Putative prokaryotic signal transducing protein